MASVTKAEKGRSSIMPLKALLLFLLRFIFTTVLGLVAATQSPLAQGQGISQRPLKALLLESRDQWTGAVGGRVLLEKAGFIVSPLHVDESFNLNDVNLIVFGSLSAWDPNYTALMRKHTATLHDFVNRGGVILEMNQNGRLKFVSAYLPAGMTARRADMEYESLAITAPNHPLFNAMPVVENPTKELRLPKHLNHYANWGPFDNFTGFRVLLASEPTMEHPALLEGSYGKGRILLTSLYFDKLYDSNDNLIAPEATLAVAKRFFVNLATYVAAVRAGIAPPVTATPGFEPAAPLPFVPGSWTIAVLPDTQGYSERFPRIYESQTRWIANNKQRYNIVYVLHLGDITGKASRGEWENARRAMSLLHGVVPYQIVGGNHDYGKSGESDSRQTLINEYFPPRLYQNWRTFGGVMEPKSIENNYHLFNAGGKDWIVLALEWAPRNVAIDWGNHILAKHANRQAIFVTHAYISIEGRLFDHTKGPQPANPHTYPFAKLPDAVTGGINDGKELWDKLVSRHANIVFALCGHIVSNLRTGEGLFFLPDKGIHGNVVNQMAINYQDGPNGGDGFLRLMEFLPDGETVQIKAFSPYKNAFKTDSKNQFILKLQSSRKLNASPEN